MIDALLDTLKVVGLVGASIVVLAAVPCIISAMVDATEASDERVDEDYWMARGYEPLDKSSTGMYDVRSTMYDVESSAGCARGKGGEQ